MCGNKQKHFHNKTWLDLYENTIKTAKNKQSWTKPKHKQIKCPTPTIYVNKANLINWFPDDE